MEENKQIQTADSRAVDVTAASEQLKAMMDFAGKWLEKGKDYMTIAGANKPSLLKSGAEKMNILMGLRPEYAVVNEITGKDDQFYYVQVKCSLKDKTGSLIAECIASCNNKEKARANVAFYDSINPVLKMAEKRAYVGATLNANALSQMYTQDLEDTAEKKDAAGAVLGCVNCGKDVSQKVAEFSSNTFKGKILCIPCQDKVRTAQKA